MTEVTDHAALTPELMDRIVQVGVDWAGDGRIEWEDLLDRIERTLDIELPGDMGHPVITRIQRAIREAVREARA